MFHIEVLNAISSQMHSVNAIFLIKRTNPVQGSGLGTEFREAGGSS
jgi:hypothetical protein